MTQRFSYDDHNTGDADQVTAETWVDVLAPAASQGRRASNDRERDADGM